MTALAALKVLGVGRDAIERGFASVVWPGRFQKIVRDGRRFIVDGAHNPPAIRVLVDTWQQTYGTQQARCIYAGSADKALDEVLQLLSPIVAEWVLPPVQSPRILPAQEMTTIVRKHSAAPICTPATLGEAMNTLCPHTLICGSFFLLGEAKSLLQSGEQYRTTMQ